jgi:hypothetical protein
MEELTKERIDEVCTYVREEGVFYWLPRDREEFPRTCNWVSWNKRCAGKVAGSQTREFWKMVIDNHQYLRDRLVWFYETGEWPDGLLAHNNGNQSDDRFDNLSIAPDIAFLSRRAVRSARNRSGVTGVHKRGDKWQAVIWDGARQKSLGFFTDRSLAVAARKKAESEYGYGRIHGRPPLAA